MILINATPHVLNIIVDGKEALTLAPSGICPRLAVTREPSAPVNGIPVVVPTMGSPEGLPEPQEGTAYIVSALVANASGRSDLVFPGEAVRDPEGRIVGCNGLCRARY